MREMDDSVVFRVQAELEDIQQVGIVARKVAEGRSSHWIADPVRVAAV